MQGNGKDRVHYLWKCIYLRCFLNNSAGELYEPTAVYF